MLTALGPRPSVPLDPTLRSVSRSSFHIGSTGTINPTLPVESVHIVVVVVNRGVRPFVFSLSHVHAHTHTWFFFLCGGRDGTVPNSKSISHFVVPLPPKIGLSMVNSF